MSPPVVEISNTDNKKLFLSNQNNIRMIHERSWHKSKMQRHLINIHEPSYIYTVPPAAPQFCRQTVSRLCFKEKLVNSQYDHLWVNNGKKGVGGEAMVLIICSVLSHHRYAGVKFSHISKKTRPRTRICVSPGQYSTITLCIIDIIQHDTAERWIPFRLWIIMNPVMNIENNKW